MGYPVYGWWYTVRTLVVHRGMGPGHQKPPNTAKYSQIQPKRSNFGQNWPNWVKTGQIGSRLSSIGSRLASVGSRLASVRSSAGPVLVQCWSRSWSSAGPVVVPVVGPVVVSGVSKSGGFRVSKSGHFRSL